MAPSAPRAVAARLAVEAPSWGVSAGRGGARSCHLGPIWRGVSRSARPARQGVCLGEEQALRGVVILPIWPRLARCHAHTPSRRHCPSFEARQPPLSRVEKNQEMVGPAGK
jgi:hypothetical protein